jgi:hypothetical protein
MWIYVNIMFNPSLSSYYPIYSTTSVHKYMTLLTFSRTLTTLLIQNIYSKCKILNQAQDTLSDEKNHKKMITHYF